MLDILYLLLPIFGLMLIGYLALAIKLLLREHIQALSQFVIKIALPCLLLINLSQQTVQQLWQPAYLISYSIASLLPFLFLLWRYRIYEKCELPHAAVYAMGGSMSNTGFIGTAVLSLLLGAQAAPFIAITFLIENLLIFLLFILCLELAQRTNQPWWPVFKQSLYNCFKNPIILSLFAGFACSVLGVRFPEPVYATLKPLAQSTAGIGLFVIDAGLYGNRFSMDCSILKDTLLVTGSKLIFMPLLVYVLLSMMPSTTPEMLFSGVLLASVSMVTLFGIFGQQMGIQHRTGPILLITTLGASISMSVVIYFLHP